MFAIGDRMWPGVSKLVEEIGELGQVCGKLMGSRGNITHWSGNLSDMMHDEIGDVLAACHFVIGRCGLDRARILARVAKKLETFERWHAEDPETHVGACDGCSRYSTTLRLVGSRVLCGGCAQ